MRGFMCHSVEATSVCAITDPRSVIVPRRPDRTSEDHSRLISSAKYSRLVQRHRFDSASKRSVIAPSFRRDDQAVNPSLESIKQPHLLTSSRSLIVPSMKSDHQAVNPSLESIKQPHLLTSSRSLTVPSVKGDHQAVNPSLKSIKQPHLPTSSRSLTVPSVKSDHQAVEPSMEAIKQPRLLNSSDNVFQVVVMRVSLHCQGCAGKVKKHLSKMEGVTSFSIDLETKRVTVMGHISPNGVLESVSKVKRAEFWPS